MGFVCLRLILYYRDPRPPCDALAIDLMQDKLVLFDKAGGQTVFTNAHLCCDCDFFLVLALGTARVRMTIFKDQLTVEGLRRLQQWLFVNKK